MDTQTHVAVWSRTANAIGLGLVLLVTSCATAPPTGAPEPVDAGEQAGATIDPRAERLIRSWSDYIQTMRHIEFDVIDTADHVTDSGQKLQYSHRHEAALSRPLRLRIQTTGDQTQRTLYKDGRDLTLLDHAHSAFARIPDPGSIDATVTELMTRYGIQMPLADLLADDPFLALLGNVTRADYLGIHTVGAARCHHLVLQGADTDRQLWIETGDTPLLRKLVVTQKTQATQPQYSMIVLRARALQEAPAGLFTFTPPPGARRVELEPASHPAAVSMDGTPAGAPAVAPGDAPTTLPPAPPGYREVTVGGIRYYLADNEYYRWDDTLGTYVLVDNPYASAEVIDELPKEAREIMIDGEVYYKCGEAYFDRVYDGSRVRYRKVHAR